MVKVPNMRGLGIALVGFTLVGCGSTATIDDGSKIAATVPLNKVVDSLKCGVARAIVADSAGRGGLYGSTAEVVVEVNVVTDRTISGSAGTTGTGIPVYSGATLGANLGASNEANRTYNTTIKFGLDLTTRSDEICLRTGDPTLDTGFSGWLTAEVKQINSVVAGPPLASIESYKYETDFIVTTKSNAGADLTFAIVPVKASASYAASRQDIQHLTISIAAVHFEKGKKKTGGVPTNNQEHE
jgi:hypothetical protein